MSVRRSALQVILVTYRTLTWKDLESLGGHVSEAVKITSGSGGISHTDMDEHR